MKAVIQRVSRASVVIDKKQTASIGKGLLILLGVMKGDDETHAKILAKKCVELRIFEDGQGKMNLSSSDVGAEILVVSQFTLGADLRRGRRPSFDGAADPTTGERLYDFFTGLIKDMDLPLKTGRFAAHMEIELINDGPVTIIVDSNDLL